MNLGSLFAAALSLLFFPAQSTFPTETSPLRNTFVVAAETVIDDAGSVDLKADDAHFDGQMQSLKKAKENLDSMASEDREHDIAVAANDILFAIAACHIQAKDGANTAGCESQVNKARLRVMEKLNKHKSAGAWVDGPPS